MTKVQDDYEERLRAKLAPERIRETLSYAGLVLIVYEQIKQAVVEDVRSFYVRGLAIDQPRYDREVLSLDKNRFRASAKWLLRSDAITEGQIEILERLHTQRTDLAHELIKYIVDVDHQPDRDLFIDALGVYLKIRKFWTRMEIEFGTFEAHKDMLWTM